MARNGLLCYHHRQGCIIEVLGLRHRILGARLLPLRAGDSRVVEAALGHTQPQRRLPTLEARLWASACGASIHQRVPQWSHSVPATRCSGRSTSHCCRCMARTAGCASTCKRKRRMPACASLLTLVSPPRRLSLAGPNTSAQPPGLQHSQTASVCGHRGYLRSSFHEGCQMHCSCWRLPNRTMSGSKCCAPF